MTKDTMDDLSDAAEKAMDGAASAAAEARARLEDAESQARSFIQEYPLGSLAAAVLTGYVVARLLPRI